MFPTAGDSSYYHFVHCKNLYYKWLFLVVWIKKKKKKSHSFINGSNPFSPTLYVVDLWTTIFTGVFPNTETDGSVLVHTFQGKMKTHWKHSISPAMPNCLNTSEICLSFGVWSLWNKNCSYNALQVETPTSTKQHFKACAQHLHISLQGQADMFSPTNQKYINVSLFNFHDVTPHSQTFTAK